MPTSAAPPERTTAEDHQQMMRQLGITALRPGPSGNEQAPNHANYDESRANPFPDYPDALTFDDGRKVETAQDWPRGRVEIIEAFEREVYGRIPRRVPKVQWSVAASDTGTVAGRRVIGRQLVGRVDNSSYPAIDVNIAVTLVLPADARRPVPVMMLFRGGIGSSGAGGVKPHRRNFGEAVENLTGSGEYHWMAGNFLEYGTAESSFGSRNAGDIPVDAHQLLQWADKFFGRQYTPAPPVPAAAGGTALGAAPVTSQQQGWQRADVPVPRTDSNSMIAHRQLLAKRTQGRIDVYFLGNSITRRWGATDYPELLAHWNATFRGWNAANFGWGGDRIQNILWRIENGELDGVNPKVIVILAGTNNVGTVPGGDEKVADVTRGLRALVDLCRRKAPNATIILTGIFPRNDNMAVMPEIDRINENLARFADGKTIRYLDVNDKLADRNGVLFEGMMGDKLHPTLEGYRVWAAGLTPLLTELLGPPAATDQAPPPTGDPSARRPPSR